MTQSHLIKELIITTEQYRTICLSTGHLCQEDKTQLDILSSQNDCNMVMKRDTGWFVKLYEPETDDSSDQYQNSNIRSNMSLKYNKMIITIVKAGFRMMEFDCDTEHNSSFPDYELALLPD